MAARLPNVPLHVVCANPQCQSVFEVHNRYEQKTRKCCSQRCNGVLHAKRFLTRDVRSRGGNASKVKRRAARMRELASLSPVEIYRSAYAVGWKAGVRAARRRAAGARS